MRCAIAWAMRGRAGCGGRAHATSPPSATSCRKGWSPAARKSLSDRGLPALQHWRGRPGQGILRAGGKPMLREPELNKNRKRAEYAPVRILLLEDDPLFADLLQTQLRRLPWAESRLEVAATLAEAREKLAAESFGLVLADLNLPDSYGLQTV